MRAAAAAVWMLCALAAVSGCYKPSPAECALQCTAASGCPAGLTCANDFCVEPGSDTVCGGDAGEIDADIGLDDAMPDAPLPTRQYRTLAVGVRHACAVDTMGRLWCWGSHSYGQLGDGAAWSTAPQPLP
jgi:hypothetical protein